VFHAGYLVKSTPPVQPPDTFRDNPLALESEGDLLKPPSDDYLAESPEAYKPGRLIYASDPLEAPITVAGVMKVLASISLDTPDADVWVGVDAILPGGRTLVLGQDMLRGRFRNGMSKPELVTPGAIEPWRFDGSWFTVRQLPKGTRLRVVFAPMNTPDWQKNYNSGGRIGYETAKDARTAAVTIHLDPRHPSYLELPLAREEPVTK
jgi:predicted acyl esterase